MERTIVRRITTGNYAGIWTISGLLVGRISPSQMYFTDVLFEECVAQGRFGGGAIGAMDFSQDPANEMKVRLHRCTFRNCVAEQQQGGALWVYKSDVAVTECTFDGCQAYMGGGGLVVYGTKVGFPMLISGCNFTNCVADPSDGGGAYLIENAETIIEDTTFNNCRAPSRNGGAIGSGTGDQVLTLRRVTMYRCSSGERGGGMAYFGVVTVVDSHFIECSSFDGAGAIDMKSPLTFNMIGGSITRCYVTATSFGDSGAYWSFAGSTAFFTGVDIVDSYNSGGYTTKHEGDVTLKGCRLLRLGSPIAGVSATGAMLVALGTTVVEDTIIEGRTIGGPPSPSSYGCVRASGGTLLLRNTTLSNCATDSAKPYLLMEGGAELVGSLVDFAPECDSTPLLVEDNRKIIAPLALRGMRVVSDGCSGHRRLAHLSAGGLFSAGTTVAACSELSSIGADAACGTAATCLDVPIFAGSAVTSAECSCTGNTYARDTAEFNAAMLPYTFGCFTPRVATSVSRVGITTSNVIFRLLKNATSDRTEMQQLKVELAGTDTQQIAVWSVGAAPYWLSVPQSSGLLSPNESYAIFDVTATTAMVPGREEPHQAFLNISVRAGEPATFAVPIFLFVKSVTVDIAWGRLMDGSELCANATIETPRVIAGSTARIPFVGCDRDGLTNPRNPNSFTALAIGPDAATLPAVIEYDSTTAGFAAQFTPLLSGDYSLTLELEGQAVGSALRVVAVPCMEGFIPNMDLATQAAEPCVACEGDKTALPGDLACIRCRRDLYMTEDGSCEFCPIGSDCTSAGTTLETLELRSGYWRLSNKTTNVKRCDWSTDVDKTPCAGGQVGNLCVNVSGLHGPLCRLCPEPSDDTSMRSWYKESEGRCQECPPPSTSVGAIVGVVAAIIIVTALLAYIYYHPTESLARVSEGLKFFMGFIARLGLWAKFKQLISFFQVLYSLGTVYRTTLPPQFYDAFEWIGWITFDLLDIYPAACFGPFRSRLLVTTVGPLVLIAIVIVVCPVGGAILGLFGSKMTWRSGAALGGAITVVIVWVLVPPVSKTVFEIFDCELFGVADVVNSSAGGESLYEYESFLHTDMRISCTSDEYGELTGLAGLFVVIWPIAMPLLLAALLVGAHKMRRTKPLLSRAAAPLMREYDALSYYWEALELTRRLVLCAVVLAIPTTQSIMRLAVAMVTCFIYLIGLSIVRPFKRADDLLVAAASNVLLIFTFLVAFLVKIFDDVAAKTSTSIARDVMGFEDSFQVSLIFIVIGFFQVVIVAAVILSKLYRALAAARKEALNRNIARARRAIDSAKQLHHPCVFVSFSTLRRLGEFTSHETIRDLGGGELLVLDTYDQLADFTRDEATVFVSHQWLARDAPDPDGVQYKALLDALDALCNLKSLTADKLYVWLDYSSIPQVAPQLKQLAVDSLAVYSSACRYFITLAPDAVHADTLKTCDEASYHKRGWCRLEQWANATSGFTGMYIFGAKRVLEPISSHDAMKDSIFVFEGDFTMAADRHKIVDTVLGLWSIVLANKGELLDRVNPERERVFPKVFCGELPDLLEEQMQVGPAVVLPKDAPNMKKRLSSPTVDADKVSSTILTADSRV